MTPLGLGRQLRLRDGQRACHRLCSSGHQLTLAAPNVVQVAELFLVRTLHQGTAMTRIASLLLLVGCASEPIEATPCEQASTTLERCTGEVPEGFRDACDATPDQVATAILAETDADRCPDLGRADIGRTTFIGACVASIHAAYWVVWARSPSSQPLSRELADQLRPWVGDLVDTARVSWNSGLLTHWRVFGHDVVLEEDIAAQTFGNEIFVNETSMSASRKASLIGHELGHVGQYRKYGGVTGFAREYCSSFYDTNFSYRDNALEVEAYDLQGRIELCLDDGSDCL